MKKETYENMDNADVLNEQQEETGEEIVNEEVEIDEAAEEAVSDENAAGGFELKLLESKDKLLRIMAEFENFKKRTAKEKEDLYGLVVCETVAAMLPIYDNLERAINASGDLPQDDTFLVGVKMVQKQFSDTLTAMGVEYIKAVGESFNPEVHNAVMHIEDENAGENMIVEELMKGYVFKGRVIRHSMVKVAN